jgi:hypothetical protein
VCVAVPVAAIAALSAMVPESAGERGASVLEMLSAQHTLASLSADEVSPNAKAGEEAHVQVWCDHTDCLESLDWFSSITSMHQHQAKVHPAAATIGIDNTNSNVNTNTNANAKAIELTPEAKSTHKAQHSLATADSLLEKVVYAALCTIDSSINFSRGIGNSDIAAGEASQTIATQHSRVPTSRVPTLLQ